MTPRIFTNENHFKYQYAINRVLEDTLYLCVIEIYARIKIFQKMIDTCLSKAIYYEWKLNMTLLGEAPV
jgi:hypothetical protein